MNQRGSTFSGGNIGDRAYSMEDFEVKRKNLEFHFTIKKDLHDTGANLFLIWKCSKQP